MNPNLAQAVGFREAAAATAGWVSLALAFDVALYFYARWTFARDPRLAGVPGFDPDAAAWQMALEFLTGYVVEYSLSVDNIFVFVLVLGYFAVPARHQRRVLFFGILGALVFRAAFVALGSVLMQFHWVILDLRGVPNPDRREARVLREHHRARAQPAPAAAAARDADDGGLSRMPGPPFPPSLPRGGGNRSSTRRPVATDNRAGEWRCASSMVSG